MDDSARGHDLEKVRTNWFDIGRGKKARHRSKTPTISTRSTTLTVIVAQFTTCGCDAVYNERDELFRLGGSQVRRLADTLNLSYNSPLSDIL